MKIPLRLAKNKDLPSIGINHVAETNLCSQTLQLLDEYRAFTRSLSVMLENCTGCGACAKACHSYLGTGDFFNIPAARAGLLRRIFVRYFTWSGRIFGGFAGAGEIERGILDRWVEYFYQCNACRRCAVFCPFGIDTGEVVLAGRNILSRLGIVPSFMADIARNELTSGNNTGILEPAILDSCSFLEEELLEETGLQIKIPVDKPHTRILYLPSSSELFVNSDTLMAAAKVFHYLGLDWTLSSMLLEAANYGLLFDREVMKKHNGRIRAAASAVGAKKVLMGECGHGWRAARMYTEGANGPFPFQLQHILELVAECLPELRLTKLPIRATLHDPCNYGRGAGLVDGPRKIMRACVADLVEMTPNRDRNFCCGGGGGLLMDEMKQIRMQLGEKKAEQIRSLLPLDYIAVPCASCKAQFPLLIKHYGMGEVRTGGVIDLVGKSLDMRGSAVFAGREPNLT
ncbi:MAG: (Fe-S)-binding protein [Geobacteraceae bacterium]|nr:(Fe-S)-binding protein [Geobacteraceae bacterium]